jgi:hypothetical protein
MLEWVDTFKYLGITINQNMTWSDHIESLVSRANRRIGLLRRVKHLLPHHARITLYNTLILPILDYADIVWGDKDNITLMNMLQIVQNKAAKTILDLPMYASSTEALSQIKSNDNLFKVPITKVSRSLQGNPEVCPIYGSLT